MKPGVGVVITSYNQGNLIRHAVESVRAQTRPADEVVVVDDGSSDPASLGVLDDLERDGVRVLRQANRGVSAARNVGIRAVDRDFVAVLDGDDRYSPEFLARAVPLLEGDPDVLAVSSWLQMVGVAAAVVRPTGGSVAHFLSRNAAPASAVLRRRRWAEIGGYDETMVSGFEDWDLFLSMLTDGGRVAIVPECLVEYRTAITSANVRSMDGRLALYGQLIDKHRPLFERHLREVLLAHETTSTRRLAAWEAVVIADPGVAVDDVTFGDGGMAAAVRIASARTQTAQSRAVERQP